MRFTVRILPRAEQEYNSCLDYIASRSKAGATAWANAYRKALGRLRDNADTCPLATENDWTGFEVRDILFRTRRGRQYRILFTIVESTLWIMHVRGPGQDFVGPDEIANPPE
jgi:toxin ParE1/3/4